MKVEINISQLYRSLNKVAKYVYFELIIRSRTILIGISVDMLYNDNYTIIINVNDKKKKLKACIVSRRLRTI
jgi:hypothetical protein